MKRFHVHVHVEDLPKNIAFYSAMFNQQPARSETDYAKWMLDDPPVNFAISTRGGKPGVDHLGIQVDSTEQLAALKDNASRADMTLLDAALIPHGRTVFEKEIMAASLDHALWLHRPFRADEWLLYAQHSPSSHGARGFCRGSIFTREGVLVASVVQEASRSGDTIPSSERSSKMSHRSRPSIEILDPSRESG